MGTATILNAWQHNLNGQKLVYVLLEDMPKVAGIRIIFGKRSIR